MDFDQKTMKGEKIKILYLCESLKVGGAEQLILTTVKNLDPNRLLPVICCLREKGEIGKEIEDLGFKVITLSENTHLLNYKILKKLLRVIRDERPDILHSHLFYANYFGRIAAVLKSVPVVIITEHGTHSNFKKIYHHLADFILSFFTDKIIAVSDAVRKYLTKYSLIPNYKITVIYNAVDTDRFDKAYHQDNSLLRKRLGFTDSDLLIGCVSTLTHWKGQFLLLESFAELLKVFPSAKLCLVGRNNKGFREQLENFIKWKGILKNVLFMGERRDVPEILKALDIFVLPSLTEGLGIALLEAMYMELPVVASKTEGIVEIIDDNQDGLLFNQGDSNDLLNRILTIIQDRSKATKLGLNAKKKISELFSPQRYIKQLESLYILMCNKNDL